MMFVGQGEVVTVLLTLNMANQLARKSFDWPIPKKENCFGTSKLISTPPELKI
jgi:hypothetical protein